MNKNAFVVLLSAAGLFFAGAARAAFVDAVPASPEIGRLAALHAPAAALIPGSLGISVVALQPYGLGISDYAVEVKFDQVGPAVAAVRSGQLPRALPAAKDGTPVHMSYSLPESAVLAYHDRNEARIQDDLWGIPGVVGVEKHETSAYGPMSGVTNRDFVVRFANRKSLNAARAAGRLPRRMTALRDLAVWSRTYGIMAEVDEPASQDPR